MFDSLKIEPYEITLDIIVYIAESIKNSNCFQIYGIGWMSRETQILKVLKAFLKVWWNTILLAQ